MIHFLQWSRAKAFCLELRIARSLQDPRRDLSYPNTKSPVNTPSQESSPRIPNVKNHQNDPKNARDLVANSTILENL